MKLKTRKRIVASFALFVAGYYFAIGEYAQMYCMVLVAIMFFILPDNNKSQTNQP